MSAETRPSVLVIDDVAANVRVLVNLLKDSYTVFFATDGPSGLELAHSQPPDLVLLDVSMPGMDGYEVCRRLKTDPQTSPIPVVFITAMAQEEDEARGLSLGAIDYITKPFSTAIVLARVKNHIELSGAKARLEEAHALLAQKIRELDEKNRALEVLSVTDRLTGLSNRRKLDEALQSELLRARRYGKPFSVIMLDVDRFKSVNDRFGHQVGDEALVRLARILSGNARETDVLGRWGGEEFLLVCPETGLAFASALAERLRREVEAETFPRVGLVTASFGVAAFLPGDGVEALIRRADEALYRAKQNGRNRVATADPQG